MSEHLKMHNPLDPILSILFGWTLFAASITANFIYSYVSSGVTFVIPFLTLLVDPSWVNFISDQIVKVVQIICMVTGAYFTYRASKKHDKKSK